MAEDTAAAAAAADSHGLMVELRTPEALLAAVAAVRAAGYSQLDAYAPYPVDGLDEALDLRDHRVPLMALIGGLLGGAGAYFMQWYAAAVDYPLNVGGRPLHSAPSFIPITFELTILSAAVSAVVAMLACNRLPMPYHPVFNVPAFRRASQDRFFICIEASDPQFHRQRTRELLLTLGGEGVYDVES